MGKKNSKQALPSTNDREETASAALAALSDEKSNITATRRANLAMASNEKNGPIGYAGAAEINEPANAEAVEEPEIGDRWNSSRLNVYRFLAINWSFLIIGMNDACIGVS